MLGTLWGTYRSKYEHFRIGVLPVKGIIYIGIYKYFISSADSLICEML